MSNFYLNTKIVQRSKGQSIVDRTAYITGRVLNDSYTGRTYDRRAHRGEISHAAVVLPYGAPKEFKDLQFLLNELNLAERRSDAQMARSYILSLPNELTLEQQAELLHSFVEENFATRGQCAILAIHLNQPDEAGRESLPLVNGIQTNPHAHLVVPFRAIGTEGFQRTKLMSRSTNNQKYLVSLRENWAAYQNRTYERLGFGVRVSHESLAMQGIARKPTLPLGMAVLALERKGVRTGRGDAYREIIEQNRGALRDLEREFEPWR